MSFDGLLNVNKPGGLTSRDAVNVIQRLARPAKVGHAGTLDPLATGVLVVCVGAATRLIEYVQRMPKSYTGTFLLGRESPTEDVEGQVTELVDPPIPSLQEIIAATGPLTGCIEQRPPAYSALKVNGRRAYDLAREGKPVELAPRPIDVHRLEVVEYCYPELTLRIECGSGTYVRSLGRDLAASLGTAAVMSGLVRTAIGDFSLETSILPRELAPGDWNRHLLPMHRAVTGLPRIELTSREIARVHTGQTIPRGDFPADADEIAAVDASGHLASILVRRKENQLGPARNFPLPS